MGMLDFSILKLNLTLFDCAKSNVRVDTWPVNFFFCYVTACHSSNYTPRCLIVPVPNRANFWFSQKKGLEGVPNRDTKVSVFGKKKKSHINDFIFSWHNFHIFIFFTKLVRVVWPLGSFRLYGRFLIMPLSVFFSFSSTTLLTDTWLSISFSQSAIPNVQLYSSDEALVDKLEYRRITHKSSSSARSLNDKL